MVPGKSTTNTIAKLKDTPNA